jgi:hypothetical protein
LNPSSRPFFLPILGLVALFAAFGPAVGGAVFIPLAFLLEAPLAVGAAAQIGWIATLLGHALALVPAYIIGFGPAAATGFVYGLWDAAAPERAPRALAAAIIGGALTYGLYSWLAALGASLEESINFEVSAAAGGWIDPAFSGEFDATLRDALVASGAVAGLICGMVASLMGLTTRGSLTIGQPALTPPGGVSQ